MRQAHQFNSLVAEIKPVGNLFAGFVHHHHRNFSVFVDKSRGEQLRPVGRTDDPFGARADEFGEMPDVVIGVHVVERTGLGFGVHRGEAEVADMVGAAGFVEEDIPVGPGHSAVVEIVDHVFAVLLAPLPLIEGLPAERVVAGFGQQQVFARKRLGYAFDIFVLAAAVPDFIPVKTDAPDVFRRLRVGEQGVGALVQQVAVVVPGNEFFIGHFHPRQLRAQVVFDKIRFILGRVNTGLPGLFGHGFVLHRKAPDRHPPGFVGLDKIDVVLCPTVVIFRQQFAALKHVVVVFHPGGRAPRTGKKFHLPAGFRHRFFDERDLVFFIVGNVESAQAFVAVLHVRVHVAGKIAAVDVGPSEGVADPFFGIVVGGQKFLLAGGREFGESLRRGVGDGAADADEGLKLVTRVDEDAGLVFKRLAEGFELESSGWTEAVVGTVGSGVHSHAGPRSATACSLCKCGD